MSLQVTYRYKTQKPDQEQRRAEGIKTLKNYPSKVPVRINIQIDCKWIEHEVISRVMYTGMKRRESWLWLLCRWYLVKQRDLHFETSRTLSCYCQLHLQVRGSGVCGSTGNLWHLSGVYLHTRAEQVVNVASAVQKYAFHLLSVHIRMHACWYINVCVSICTLVCFVWSGMLVFFSTCSTDMIHKMNVRSSVYMFIFGLLCPQC